MFLEERSVAAVSAAEAERLAADLYGVASVATALPGEYDCNFHLQGDHGHAFVLKCMHPARTAPFIEMQSRALEHLREKAPRLSLPRVQRTKQGTQLTEIADSAGQKRLVWMLSFLPGVTLEKANPHSSGILRDLGRFLGELDAALGTFSHPAVYRELKWDSSRAGWIRDQLHHIAEPSQRALVKYFLSLYEDEVESRRSDLRTAPIYGDASHATSCVDFRVPSRSTNQRLLYCSR
jgi:Ser/Thr protein kinase RdoA (MazF antagonist)